MNALPVILMPFSRHQLRLHHPPYKAARDDVPERDSLRHRLDKWDDFFDQLNSFGTKPTSESGPSRLEWDELRSIQRNEEYWTAAYLLSLFYRPTQEERVQALGALLSRTFGSTPPLDEKPKAKAGIRTWDDCLRGDLRLLLEPGLSSPKPYRDWIGDHIPERQPLSVFRGAFSGSGIEGRTHADALFWNPANKFALYIEAKVLADADCMSSYDGMRNQITRYVDAMLEPTRVPIGRRYTEPGLTLFALLTPRMFQEERHARLYGRLMTEYQDPVAGLKALERDMPYRAGANWAGIIPRLGWMTWEDCLEVCPEVRSELTNGSFERSTSNPELSRRVARLMHMEVIGKMDMQAKQAFVRTIDHTASFDELPPAYQQIILVAERDYHPLDDTYFDDE